MSEFKFHKSGRVEPKGGSDEQFGEYNPDDENLSDVGDCVGSQLGMTDGYQIITDPGFGSSEPDEQHREDDDGEEEEEDL